MQVKPLQRSRATVGRISIKNLGLCLRGRVGPGQENIDLAFSETVAINWPVEKSSFQFRGEFYNVLNHPQFSNPDANFTSPTFGVITSTAVNPRVAQLALRFGF